MITSSPTVQSIVNFYLTYLEIKNKQTKRVSDSADLGAKFEGEYRLPNREEKYVNVPSDPKDK